MKTIKLFSILVLLAICLPMGIHAQSAGQEKPTIIFVHGIWADGSCWSQQILALQSKGYNVISVQNTITSLEEDVLITKRAIDRTQGNILLVGHSWGGMVITQAGNNPRVIGLVYLAAFAPEEGESLSSVSKNAPKTELSKYLKPTDGFVFISEDGVKNAFGPDLPAKKQNLVYATQVPAAQRVFEDKSGVPAWKSKPSWFIVAKDDKTIHPDLERFMSKRMKASTTEIASSHVMMLSHPTEVLKVIEEAATAKIKP